MISVAGNGWIRYGVVRRRLMGVLVLVFGKAEDRLGLGLFPWGGYDEEVGGFSSCCFGGRHGES